MELYSPLIRYEAFRPFLPIIKPSFTGKLALVVLFVDTFSLKVGLQTSKQNDCMSGKARVWVV